MVIKKTLSIFITWPVLAAAKSFGRRIFDASKCSAECVEWSDAIDPIPDAKTNNSRIFFRESFSPKFGVEPVEKSPFDLSRFKNRLIFFILNMKTLRLTSSLEKAPWKVARKAKKKQHEEKSLRVNQEADLTLRIKFKHQRFDRRRSINRGCNRIIIWNHQFWTQRMTQGQK